MTLKNDFHEEDGALLLAAAILDRAKDDYINAIVEENKELALALERFFLSPWGQELALCQGEIIVARCQQIAAEKIERRRRRRKRDTTSQKK